MSLRLTVRRLAEADLREARDWYDERRPGLGGEFLAVVNDLLHSIAQNPRAFPDVHRGVRRAVLRRFPYVVYFSLATDEVIVLACLHGKQSLERLHRR